MPHDDFATEPVKGLPERPPSGESILWQGRPDTVALARDSMSLYWVIGYFAVLAVWRVGASTTIVPFAEALTHALPFVILGAIVSGLILLTAWVLARTTVYTVTTARVAMRVGAALTVTLNLPYTKIARADAQIGRSGIGTIVFETAPDARLSYLVLWPHVRPWRMRRVQPALRAIPEAARVAELVAEAAETRVSQPAIAPKPAAPAVAAE